MINGKPHVLLMFEFWRYGQEHRGIACHDLYFKGSLESTGLAHISCAYFDANRLIVNGEMHQAPDRDQMIQATLALCQQRRPDMILYEPVWKNQNPPSPPGILLARLAWELKIPMVGLLHDTGPCACDLYDVYYPMVDTVLVMDARPIPGRVPSRKFTMELPAPYDSRIVYPIPDREKDIPVSFVGTIPGDGNREWVFDLQRDGIPIHIVTTCRNQNPENADGIAVTLSPDDYYALHRRSRIVLNFSGDVRKGRLFEGMLCGALVFETTKSVTSQYLSAGYDYVPYTTYGDLLDGLRYYLDHDDARQQIARQGLETAQQKYSARAIWSRLFEIVQEKHGRFA